MYLYVNNYRGFKDTIIPIKDVNFFVGENSTGKTSILKLIKLLSGHQYGYNLDLTSSDLSFHLFSDLFNEASGKNKLITIGLYIDDDNYHHHSAILFNFSSKNNLTSLKSYRFFSLENQFHFEVEFGENNAIKARYKFLDDKDKLNLDIIKKNDLRDLEFQPLTQSIFLQPRLIDIDNQVYVKAFNEGRKDYFTKGFSHPVALSEIVWFAPIRSEPKRTYDNYLPSYDSSGSHIPYILRDLLSKRNKDSKDFLNYLNSFGKASGLFDEITIKEYDDENTAPFEVDILLNGISINLINVGYGISQVLPILVEILTSKKIQSFAIQQPEIHLHPKGQAAMGEFFYNSWRLENKRFFIETHSDYLIDRFRISMNKNKRAYKKQDGKCQVLFFNRTTNGNKVTPIAIEADGKYAEDMPKEFRDFFIKEELEIFSLYAE